MIRRYSPFALLSFAALVCPWFFLGAVGGGDRTGDMAGMGAVLVIFAFAGSALLVLILTVASFLFREKHCFLTLVALSIAILMPSTILMLSKWSYSKSQALKIQQAQAWSVKMEAEVSNWYETFREHPEQLLHYDSRTADTFQHLAFERAISKRPLDISMDLLSKLYEKGVQVQVEIIQHPKIDSEFLVQRFPDALRLELDGQLSPLAFMVRHPALPEPQLREVATSLDVSETSLAYARAECRRRAGMSLDEIQHRSTLDATDAPQAPGDVLPPIPSGPERRDRREKLAEQLEH